MHYYIDVLKKYAVFSGRARRAEYWYFALFNFIFSIVAVIIDSVTGVEVIGVGPIYIIYTLAAFIPSLAVSVRRLHDTGRSGWYILISVIPIIGGIWLLILMVLDSTPGDNKYGPNPKGISAQQAASNVPQTPTA